MIALASPIALFSFLILLYTDSGGVTLLSASPSILCILYCLFKTFFVIIDFFPFKVFVKVRSNFLSLSIPKTKIIKKVLKRKYNIQRIDGLAESKVTPPESVYKRIKKENNAIGEARAINSDLIFFKEKFIMPVEGIISGVYGSQRILNGKPRWPHYGIDIAAKLGTMIKSSGAGIVTMAEDDLYYTGGTIIMDHGHGISTIYSHLENVLVSVGDKINQGDIIGTVGSTGRSTGPHLDFRINWFQTRLDPMSVLK